MHHDIFHFRIIDRLLRGGPPRILGGLVRREHPDDVNRLEISKVQRLRVGNATAKDKMKVAHGEDLNFLLPVGRNGAPLHFFRTESAAADEADFTASPSFSTSERT